MKLIDCAQGSPEWRKARAGIPTSSSFDEIITPAKGDLSKSSTGYRNRLLVEYIQGEPFEGGYQSPRMAEGNLYEQEAADDYRFKYAIPNGDGEVTPCGFFTRDDDMVGSSPDRGVGDKGLLELKCNIAEIHMGYIIDPDALKAKHRCQTQGQLYVCTDREWVDTASFCKALNSLVVVRSYRDEEFQSKLGAALDAFVADLLVCRKFLEDNHAHLFVRPKPAEIEQMPYGLTEADLDVDALWEAAEDRRQQSARTERA